MSTILVNGKTYQMEEEYGDWLIHSDDAMALGLYYNNFYVPNGGQVFIYNETKDHVIGAFTAE